LTYGTVSDNDGNTYKTIQIGTQTWMSENLKTTKYNDGTNIPNETNNVTWAGLSSGAYCWYNNDASNKATYGALYNWYAVNTTKLCPTGWHVPTETEWVTLTTYLGGTNVAGGKIKETGTTHWISPNTGATNESGFTALPAGYRDIYGGNGGVCYNLGNVLNMWTATSTSSTFAYYREMQSNLATLTTQNYYRENGYSVRCIQEGLNNPPSAPSSPTPSNGSTSQSVSPTLSWSCSDPDGDALTYDVYFGTSSNPTTTIATNQSAASIGRSGLTNNTTYYWKIVAKDSKGASTTGAVWSFTTLTKVNNPPNAPSSPTPSNGSTGQSISPTLSWSCSDPDGDALTYDVYFGTSSNPTTSIASNQSSSSISRNGLTAGTTYYWKVVAKDSKGATTSGSIWNFTTAAVIGDPAFISHTATASNIKLVVDPVYTANVSISLQISNYQNATDVLLLISGTNPIHMVNQGNGVYSYNGVNITILKDSITGWEGSVTIYSGTTPKDIWSFSLL
jgi:uncharacterized protein (TIGR02145 family)